MNTTVKHLFRDISWRDALLYLASIAQRHQSGHEPVIATLCGDPGTGKKTFAKQLMQIVAPQGLQSSRYVFAPHDNSSDSILATYQELRTHYYPLFIPMILMVSDDSICIAGDIRMAQSFRRFPELVLFMTSTEYSQEWAHNHFSDARATRIRLAKTFGVPFLEPEYLLIRNLHARHI
jgi:tRNA uridine 5-carbamoylmethylation protein Kti12